MLQAFAQADPKPTTCRPPVSVTTTVLKAKSVATRVRVDLGPDPKRPGKRRIVVRTVRRTVQVPTTVTSEQPGPAAPCYVDGPGRAPRFAVDLSRAEVRAYETTAEAILTLAHEAVHLGGAVGGNTTSGLSYGDPLAEARAECSGMQWMAYVARQLGGSAADPFAISQFQARWRYPLRNTPGNAAEYWSADCVAGGALDSRTDRAAPWPSGLG